MIGVNVWWVYLAPQNIPVQLYWHLAIKLYIALQDYRKVKAESKETVALEVKKDYGTMTRTQTRTMKMNAPTTVTIGQGF